MPPKREKLKTGKEESLYGLVLQDGKVFPSVKNRTEKKSCRVRHSNKGEAIIFGKADRWDIVGHKTSEVRKSR